MFPPFYDDKRLRDFIDARSGVPGDFESVVYYLGGSNPNRTVFWPEAALVDQTHAAYRAWRVQEIVEGQVLAGWDFPTLNHKLAQYNRSSAWIDGPNGMDVTEVNQNQMTPWTAPPIGYGLAEYVQGWEALSQDLLEAGVPYSVWIDPFPFRAADGLDDPETPELNEAELVRQVVRNAALIVLARAINSVVGDDEFRSIVESLRMGGSRVLVAEPSAGHKVDGPCPYN